MFIRRAAAVEPRHDMLIPARILEVVGGPLLAVAALGCSTSPGLPEQGPGTGAEIVSVVDEGSTDPVSYDATAETERLNRTFGVLANADVNREERIDDEAAAQRRRRARGTREMPPDQMLIAPCGRG
jgi:hypothetical protein